MLEKKTTRKSTRDHALDHCFAQLEGTEGQDHPRQLAVAYIQETHPEGFTVTDFNERYAEFGLVFPAFGHERFLDYLRWRGARHDAASRDGLSGAKPSAPDAVRAAPEPALQGGLGP